MTREVMAEAVSQAEHDLAEIVGLGYVGAPALRAAAAELRKMDWQPIATAPKDGVSILGWFPEWQAVVTVFWQDGQWWMPISRHGLMAMRGNPTMGMWHPLPAPPANTEGGTGK